MPQTIKRQIDVVIIPGSRHTNKQYWYPQLANSLQKNGLEVLVVMEAFASSAASGGAPTEVAYNLVI